MIISHKYKFIFIKTRKTAGTSLEVYLSKYCSDEDILTPIYPHVEPHKERNFDGFYNHIPAIEIRKQVSSDVWNNYFKFCVERNPWDKTLSYFYMQQKRLDKKFNLDDYFETNDFCTDYDMYVDTETNSLLVDQILKYENLNNELAVLFQKLSIPFDGILNINAKSEYRSDRRPYNEVLNKEQMNIIENKFSREIKLLKYSRYK